MWIFLTTSTPLLSIPHRPRPEIASGLAAALSFYSRINLGYAASDIGIAWHGVAGLIIGLIITCAAYLIWLCGGGQWPFAFLAGWAWIFLEIWLTRGLHWDGVADVGDALGSGASGEKFRAILKDSRIGAFGAMSLCGLMAGQGLAVACHFAYPAPASMACPCLAPAWGRLGPAWLGHSAKPYSQQSLGALVCQQASRQIWILAWLQGAIFLAIPCFLGLRAWQALLILACQLGLNYWYSQTAKKYGGLSGDFFGSHIEASQLLYLLLSLPLSQAKAFSL